MDENSVNGSVTSYGLKMLAVITMIIDHFGATVLERCMLAEHLVLEDAWSGKTLAVFYLIVRLIGRISFPVILFMLVQGFFFTKSRGKYILRMAIFSILSEIPFDMAFQLRDDEIFSGKLVEFTYQNVFFTLTVSLIMMWGLYICENKIKNIYLEYSAELGIIGASAAICYFLNTDYGMGGIFAAAALYVFRMFPGMAFATAVMSLCIFDGWVEAVAIVALPIIVRYTGARGKRVNKYLFYVLYPVHLLLLWGVCWFEGLMK